MIKPGHWRLDPDPALYADAADSNSYWSRSLEVFLRKVPEAKLVLTVTSGVLTRDFLHHPITWLFKNDHERRRLIEFMQVIRQMTRGKPANVHPKISFAAPLTLDEVQGDTERISDALIKPKLMELFEQHARLYYLEKETKKNPN